MRSIVFVLLTAVTLVFAGAGAPVLADSMSDKKHKVVIQVSTDDARTQTIALNNAVNVQTALGIDNVAVEIVAYGPGLSILTKQSKQKARVESLALQDMTFSACGNTMAGIEKKTGKKPELAEGVKIVPAGVVRIMELQQQGYAYIRP
jgi:intracellular sulfur oxidation DsrE/DsrF family protein